MLLNTCVQNKGKKKVSDKKMRRCWRSKILFAWAKPKMLRVYLRKTENLRWVYFRVTSQRLTRKLFEKINEKSFREDSKFDYNILGFWKNIRQNRLVKNLWWVFNIRMSMGENIRVNMHPPSILYWRVLLQFQLRVEIFRRLYVNEMRNWRRKNVIWNFSMYGTRLEVVVEPLL